MVCDDSAVCIDIVRTMLVRCEYDVTTCTSALDALDILRREKYDLVLSDVHMPDMNG